MPRECCPVLRKAANWGLKHSPKARPPPRAPPPRSLTARNQGDAPRALRTALRRLHPSPWSQSAGPGCPLAESPGSAGKRGGGTWGGRQQSVARCPRPVRVPGGGHRRWFLRRGRARRWCGDTTRAPTIYDIPGGRGTRRHVQRRWVNPAVLGVGRQCSHWTDRPLG